MSGFVKWFNRDPSRSNQHCLYCGSHVGKNSAIASDEEHLVGRNFVPKGTMENAFNFSFRACRPCNARKAELERHVSSITLLNSPSVASDGIARRAAERKAVGDTHPETRAKMGEAIARQTAEFSFGPATFSFGLSGPSPAAKNYIPELASYHIQALFTLVATPENRTSKMSGSCPSTGSGSSTATHILIGETYNSSRSASGPQAGPAASQSSPPVVFSAPVSAVTKAPDGSGRWSGTRAFESSEGSTIRKKTTRCLKTCLLWIGNPCPMVRVFSGRNKAPPNLARICFRRIVRVDPWES
jgi:hypothetical protein